MKRLWSFGGIVLCTSLVVSTGCGMLGKKSYSGGNGGCSDGTCAVNDKLTSDDIKLTAYTPTQNQLPAPAPKKPILQAGGCST